MAIEVYNIGSSSGMKATQLVKLQAEGGGDVSTIYECVQKGVTLDGEELLHLGSFELKKLHSKLSLMQIRGGLLLIRVLIRGSEREVVVCPPQIRQQVDLAAHKLSHQGAMRTYARLMRNWHWPGMTSMVRRVVRNCDTCQKGKKLGKTCASSWGNLFAGYPSQQVGVDLVGPFPVTSRGNKWILVLTDHFSRWQDALPIADATAETVAEALETRVFSYMGLPKRLHSDRGTQFESELMQELCDFWGVEKTHTTPYHPQSNGVVERGNRTLGDALRCLLLEKGHGQSNWDLMLPQILRTFRATPNATGESANYIMFGRELKLPDQLTFGNKIEVPECHNDYVTRHQAY